MAARAGNGPQPNLPASWVADTLRRDRRLLRHVGEDEATARHLAEPGEGWRMVEDGTTALDGSFPVNMSGGVLSSNPIGASGLLRFAEAAMSAVLEQVVNLYPKTEPAALAAKRLESK